MTNDIEKKAREIGEATWLEGHASPESQSRSARAGILAGLEMAAAWHDAEAARIHAELEDPRFDGNERLMQSGADDHENAAEIIRALAKTETPG